MSSFRSLTSFVVLLAVANSGCSFLFVTPPPSQYKQPVARPEANCSTSVAAPVVDGIIGGYQLVRTAYALQADDRDYTNVPISRGADIALGVGLSALFIASTVYGGVNVSQCKRLKHGPEGDDEGGGGEPKPWRIGPQPAEQQETWQTSPAPPAAHPASAAPASPPVAAPPAAAPPAPTPTGTVSPAAGSAAPPAPSVTAPPPAASASAPAAPPKATFPDSP